MIEKLDLLKMFNERKTDAQWNKAVETTVNLLIDAVNKLQTMAKNTNTVLESLVEENKPADPYAEQKKWIGCLCRFWFDNIKQADLGVLGSIDDYSFQPYFNADLGHNYKHCEPVKPDDDIIYKSGDNE